MSNFSSELHARKIFKPHSWKKAVAVSILLIFAFSSFGNLVAATPQLGWGKLLPELPSWPSSSSSSSAPVRPVIREGTTTPSSLSGMFSSANALISSITCLPLEQMGAGTYVNTTTKFTTKASDVDSQAGSNSFSIQDNVIMSGYSFLQLLSMVSGDEIVFAVEVPTSNYMDLAYKAESLSYYPGSASYSVAMWFTYSGSSYQPDGAVWEVLNGANTVLTQYSASFTESSSTLFYQTNIVGLGNGSYADFTQSAGTITYSSTKNLNAYPPDSLEGQELLGCPGTIMGTTSETSDISYDSYISGSGTTKMQQAWSSPNWMPTIPSSSSTNKMGSHSYFNLITLDGSVATLEKNRPAWKTFGSGASMFVTQPSGLVVSTGSTLYGLVNSSAVNWGSSTQVLSFQETGSNAEVDVSSQYSNSSLGSYYLEFCICNGVPEFIQDKNGVVNTVAQSGISSDYAAWVVVLGFFGVGIEVYLNIGNQFVPLYNNPQFAIGFGPKGYEYLLSSSGTSTFAYTSTWTVDSPIAEGTFDQNVWYLSRHYERINSGTYSGDAVILDTDAPPIWLTLSNGVVLYAGMANQYLGGSCGTLVECNVVSGVLNTTATSQTLAYLFCYAGICTAQDLQAVENGGSLSGRGIFVGEYAEYVQVTVSSEIGNPVVNYTTVSETCSSSCTQSVSKLYLGGTSISVSGQSVVSGNFGFPGLRYVSRHITSVTGLLFDELGYTSEGNALTSFVNSLTSNCAGGIGCTSPYYEYYSPMFPTIVNNSLLPSNWYDTQNAFPGSSFYSISPYQEFNMPNYGGYAQYADPYISRLSIYSAQQDLWLNGIQASGGYDPSSLALRAEYDVNTGVTNPATLDSLLNSVGWQYPGTSETVCVAPQIYLLEGTSINPCYSEDAYATYNTAAFLSAASAVAAATGDPSITYDANQAASVLESILWSGNGSIANDPHVQTMWQSTGGEASAYAETSPNSGLLQYKSNQAGLFGTISSALQLFGINGIQPPESSGYEPVATEATGITAAALFNYIRFLGGQPSQPKSGFAAAISTNSDQTLSCSNPSYCTYYLAETGAVEFSTQDPGAQGTTLTYTQEFPYQVTQVVQSPNVNAYFLLNGTLTPQSEATVLFLKVNLVDAGTGNTIFSRYMSYTTGFPGQDVNFLNQTELVNFNAGISIRPGDYLLQMIVQVVGASNFTTAAPLGINLTPNEITSDFSSYAGPLTNGLGADWVPFSIGSGYCTPYNNGGLSDYGYSSSSSLFECGARSASSISYAGGPLMLTGVMSGTDNNSALTNVLAISPDLAGSTTSSIENLPDYLLLETGGSSTGGIQVVTRENGGTPKTYGANDLNSLIEWQLVIQGNQIQLQYTSSGLSGWQTILIPTPSGFDGNKSSSVYVYSYLSTTSTSPAFSNLYELDARGTPSYQAVSDTGQINDFGAQSFSITQYQSSPTVPGTGPQLAWPETDSSDYLHSSSSTTNYDGVETVSFWAIPFVVGTPVSGGQSSILVSNGAYPGDWWFEYYNSGELAFYYKLCSGGTCSNYGASTSSGLVSTINEPYFIAGTFNRTSDQICIYVNGFEEGCTTGSGSYPSTDQNTLYVGGDGNTGTYGNAYEGMISGLAVSNSIIATPNVVDQMMQSGSGGDELGGGSWYPMTTYGSGTCDASYADLFGVSPSLVWGSNGGCSYSEIDFPYTQQPSLWNPYLSPYESSANSNNPYIVSVNQTYGSYGNNGGPSLQVEEDPNLSSLNYSGPLGGFWLTPVDTSGYNPGGPLVLSFNYRTTCSPYPSCGSTNDYYIKIVNATGTVLYSNIFFPSSQSGDSGWQTEALNIGPYVNSTGSKSISIFVGVQNGWQSDWDQKAWFSNLQVSASDQQAFSALSLYRDLPTVQNGGTYSLTAQGAVEIPNYVPPSGAATVSVWFEPTGSIGDNPRIVANDHTDTTNKGFEMYYQGSDFYVALGSGTTFKEWQVPATVQPYAWYHAVMSYNGNNFCVWFYKEGTDLGSGCSAIGAGYSFSSGGYPVSVGFDPQYEGDFFPGIVSDLRIYSFALSGAQVNELDANGPTSNNQNLIPGSLWMPFDGSFADALGSGVTAVPYVGSSWYYNYVSFQKEMGVVINSSPSNLGLIGSWPLNEGSGNYAYDMSGYGNSGTLKNSPTWESSNCILSSCLSFSSSQDQFVSVPSVSQVGGGDPALTMTAWVYVSGYGTPGTCGIEMAEGYGSGTGKGDNFAIGLTSSGDVGFASYANDYNSALQVPLNTWTLIAASYSGGTGITVYMDTSASNGILGQQLTLSSRSQLNVGAWGGGVCQFNGRINDARIYNSALATSDIQVLYNTEN